MLRNKWALSALIVVGLVVLFGSFIAVRDDTALIGAMSAAGTVAAGVFAAVAAFGSLRAAAASNASAQRAREAMVRAVRPNLEPSVTTADTTLTGNVTCTGYAAIDVTVVWTLADGEAITESVARLAPGEDPLTSTLPQPVDMVWLAFADEGRVGKWQDTWQMGKDPHNLGRLTLLESRLVD
ncbi:MAG: hypothetical protein HOV71_15850 [Hamadaea sp.]|nr:hypothetical protein [Hamadaea sp.]NUR49604.1 hypothetical protein [Hamadaea sp.]NUT06799.1 hypothetical protein [Hamadaea sp.]